jgi:hypothetical protein
MPYKVNKPIRVSLDGLCVIEIPEGTYKELPEIAIQHGASLKSISGEGKAVANEDWTLPTNKELADMEAAEKEAAEKEAAEKKPTKKPAKKEAE